MLLKEFGGVDAFPICLDTKDLDEIVATVKAIAPGFGGINLEDISSPRCFEIEERLKAELDIPVFHDDQHGTAVVVMAALFNALKITGKRLEDLHVAMVGLGAAGIAVTRMLLQVGVGEIIGCDTHGAIYVGRDDWDEMHPLKRWYAENTNPRAPPGGPRGARGRRPVHRALGPGRGRGLGPRPHERGRDGVRDGEPRARGDARGGRAARADHRDRPLRLPEPDQQRAVLPGFFRGALDARATAITEEMKLAAAYGDRRGDLPRRAVRGLHRPERIRPTRARRSPRRSPTRPAGRASPASTPPIDVAAPAGVQATRA